MSLETLPIELLDEIFDNIEADLILPLQHVFQTFPLPTREHIFQNTDINRTYASLALSCRRLATIVRSRIYRTVEFPQNSSKANAFFSLIQQNPGYGQFVRTLRVTRVFQSARDELIGDRGDGYEPRAIWTHLFRHLPNLRELTVAKNPVESMILRLTDVRTDVPARKSLEKLVLEEPIYLDALFNIFSLPRLRHLDFAYWGPYHRISANELSRCPQSSLITLSVDRASTAKPLFNRILECCPALESLTCQHPISAYRELRYADDDGEWRKPPLSPKLMESVLSNSKRTLRELNIVGPKRNVEAHDETRLDLSDWTALERIKIPSYYLFKPYTYSAERNGFYKLLPPSLKSLHIIWDRSGVFFHHRTDWVNTTDFSGAFEADDARWEAEHGDNGIVREKYQWIHELAAKKRRKFPALGNVTLTDAPRWEYSMKDWYGGKALRDAFVNEDIDLVVKYSSTS